MEHPYSPTSAFPVSFLEEDMMLFTGNSGNSSLDMAAAWADMGLGQGRSVSYISDPYRLDIPQPGAILPGGAISPLASPLGLADGGGGGPYTGIAMGHGPSASSAKAGTKRGSQVDGLSGMQSVTGISITSNPIDVKPSSSGHGGGDSDNERESNLPAQKRQRRDTVATEMSSDEVGSGADGRRDSMAKDGKAERPRLTEEEKKNNHIASEQKRRMAIRDGFDRLTELVPGLEGQGRSESIVLRKTVDYMRKVIEDRRNLIQQVQNLGGEVPSELLLR